MSQVKPGSTIIVLKRLSMTIKYNNRSIPIKYYSYHSLHSVFDYCIKAFDISVTDDQWYFLNNKGDILDLTTISPYDGCDTKELTLLHKTNMMMDDENDIGIVLNDSTIYYTYEETKTINDYYSKAMHVLVIILYIV